MSSIKLGLGMIVYNEIEQIDNLFSSISSEFEDIILVVDKADEEIKRKFNNICNKYNNSKVYYSNGLEYERRNIYLEKSNSDWILVLDSDEYISVDNINKIKTELGKIKDNIGAIRASIFNYFGLGRWTTSFLPRIIKLEKYIKYNENIQHTSVSDSVLQNGMELDRSSSIIEHFGGLNNNEIEKRKMRIQDMENFISNTTPKSFLYSMISLEYISIGDIKSALVQLDKSLDVNGDKDFTRYLKALINYRLNITWVAREQLERVSKQQSFCGEATILLADMDAREYKYSSALDRLKPYVNMHPNSVFLLINYAALAVNEEPYNTIAYCKRALELLPTLYDKKIYTNGAIFNPYKFQDTFVSCYTNIFSLLWHAYENIGDLQNRDYWQIKEKKIISGLCNSY